MNPFLALVLGIGSLRAVTAQLATLTYIQQRVEALNGSCPTAGVPGLFMACPTPITCGEGTHLVGNKCVATASPTVAPTASQPTPAPTLENVDCVGHWKVLNTVASNYTGLGCYMANWTLSSTETFTQREGYRVTTPAQNDGSLCEASHGDPRVVAMDPPEASCYDKCGWDVTVDYNVINCNKSRDENGSTQTYIVKKESTWIVYDQTRSVSIGITSRCYNDVTGASVETITNTLQAYDVYAGTKNNQQARIAAKFGACNSENLPYTPDAPHLVKDCVLTRPCTE